MSDCFFMPFVFSDLPIVLPKGDLDRVVVGDKTIAYYLDLFSKNVFDTFGEQLLHHLVQQGDERLNQIKYLIEECGVDPNLLTMTNETPLHVVVKSGKTREMAETLLYLLSKGALIDAKNYYDATPLHIACEHYCSKLILKILLEAGADPNAKDNCKRRPLHYAAASKNHYVISVLVEYGAEINAKDQSGCTPLDYARAHPRWFKTKIYQVIKGYGGKRNDYFPIR